MNRQQRRAAARGSQPRTAVGDSSAPVSLFETALSHMKASRFLDAQIYCERALAGDPNHADTLHLLGLLSLQAEQYDAAIEWISRAIRQNPKADFLSDLGNVLLKQGRKTEAAEVFDKAVRLAPDDPRLWRKLGDALVDVGRSSEGILCFQRLLVLDPQDGEGMEKCALLLHTIGRPEEALPYFARCNEVRPGVAQTKFLLGRCLVDLKRFDEGISLCLEAYKLDQGNADICNVLGVALQGLLQHERALWFLDKALELRHDFIAAMNNKAVSLAYFCRWEEAFFLVDLVLETSPDNFRALVNKALYLAQVRRIDEAFKIYERLKAVAPGNPDVEWNRSLLLMLTGNLREGFEAAEAKWNAQARPVYPLFSEPKWSGEESIRGKAVLIYAEEGLGDTLQLARYVPMVVALGAKVILAVGSSARRLLENVPGVSACLSLPLTEPPAFDFHCPISSLPRIFRTELNSIPVGLPYPDLLPKSRAQAWRDRIGHSREIKIGLVWSGNPNHKNDHNRSISLDVLSGLLDVEVTFFSLQKDPRPSDKAFLSERSDIVDFTDDFSDFIETGAMISCLDLVITVDTSMAHLAAGLGKRTWLLLPYTPDPRWLLDREDSPWYPTVRLFRQDADREYAPVLDRVRDELEKLVLVRQGDAVDSRATLLFESGRLEEAVAAFARSLELRPDHAPTLQMRALALYGLNRFGEAWEDIARAHALDRSNADICNSAGVILQKLGRYEESVSWFDRVIERQRDYPAAYTNKASSQTHLCRFSEAFAVYDELLQLHPDHPEAQWAVALMNLQAGNFEAGWTGREVRWRVPNLPIFKFGFSQPIWLGKEAIAGKTVLIHVDEGLGDTIQFARYVPMVAAQGARVVLVVADALYPLLSKMPGVAECLPLSSKSLPPFDLYCPIGSLPLAFATTVETIPSATPYLPAAPRDRAQSFEDRLGRHDKLRVGLVWAGNPKHKNDSNRSIALRTLAPILDLDATFVSLQKDARPDDEVWLAEHDVMDLTGDLADFVDTAALVSCLDLVISVDTSVAHLAGALGVPTWILLPHIPDYRWMLDRDDSPWYPTVRLFRQTSTREYASVIDRMRSELIERTSKMAGLERENTKSFSNP